MPETTRKKIVIRLDRRINVRAASSRASRRFLAGVLPGRYNPVAGSLRITLASGHLNGAEALQKRLRRGLQHSAIHGFQMCQRLAHHFRSRALRPAWKSASPGSFLGTNV